MINPLRRLLYEMFLLPVLRPIQKLIDAGARIGSQGRLARRARSESVQWTHQDVLSRRARHLAMLFAISLAIPATIAQGQQTPPYFPSDSSERNSTAQQDRNSRRMPPDTSAPEHTKLTTAEVEQQIQNKLDDEPILEGLSLLASADDKTVTLRGKVANDEQRSAAVRIARSYSGSRKIVDMLKIEGAPR
jgi:osmotically-inducible protein OsmY